VTQRTAMATNPDSNVVKFPTFDATWDEDERVNLYSELAASWAMPAPQARAGRATPRAALRRLVHPATIAIAVFNVVYFGGQLLRAVLS
jgi:hypothetical protein